MDNNRQIIKCLIIGIVLTHMVGCKDNVHTIESQQDQNDSTKIVNSIDKSSITSKETESGLIDTSNKDIRSVYESSKVNVGNVANLGWTNEDEQYIYYCENDTFYKENKKTYVREIIGEGNYRYIYNLDEQFIAIDIEGRICSINKADRLKNKVLNESWCTEINVLKDWIYYINRDEDYCIYKMKLDGSNKQKLTNMAACRLNVTKDKIYYCEIDETENGDNFYWPCGKLYEMDLDGKNVRCVLDETVSFVNVIDDWIYYTNVDRMHCIYKMRKDSTEQIKLNEMSSYYLNVQDEYIYYSRGYFPIYRINQSTNTIEQLLNPLPGTGEYINLSSDTLYYKDLFAINSKVENYLRFSEAEWKDIKEKIKEEICGRWAIVDIVSRGSNSILSLGEEIELDNNKYINPAGEEYEIEMDVEISNPDKFFETEGIDIKYWRDVYSLKLYSNKEEIQKLYYIATKIWLPYNGAIYCLQKLDD